MSRNLEIHCENKLLLENISDTAIESNFWSADKTGLKVLLNRLDNSNNKTQSILNYFKQRAEIEEEYGNQLLKLAQSFEGEDCFNIISITSEITARAHTNLSQNITNMLEIPLENYMKDQENMKSFMTNQMEKSQNMRMLHIENAEKARQRYYRECENPDSTKKNIDALDSEYQKAVKLAESKVIVWANEWRELCRTFESIELHRLEYIKAVIKTFSSMVCCTCSIVDQTSERIFSAMDDMSAPNELIKFVRSFRTGSAIPNILGYRKFKGVPPKNDTSSPPMNTDRKIKDIKLPVKDDEQLRSVNDQLAKIPFQYGNSTNEELDKMSDHQYPLNPIYKKMPSKSDPALNSWYQKENTNYNSKSALITPQEREIYIKSTGWNSPPSSPTKKPSAIFGFLMKKKKSVDDHLQRNKTLSINKDLDSSKPHPDLAPPSPLFSPIDFYYSPSNDIGSKKKSRTINQ